MHPYVRAGADSLPRPAHTDLKRLAKQLRHTARLAAMALDGHDPAMGVEYLRDALAALREGLATEKRRRSRAS